MKVLRAGTGQKGWAAEAMCTGKGNGGGGCGAKLLVEEVDIFTTAPHCRDESETFSTFECTECHVWTDLKNVPTHVMTKAPRRART